MVQAKFFLVGLLSLSAYCDGFAQQYEFLNLGTGSAYAINNAGQAVGVMPNSAGVFQAVLWDHGSPSFLSGLGNTSSASAINGSGQIAGSSWDYGLVARGVVWSGGAITMLASNPSYAYGAAVGINDSGIVVGNVSSYYGGPSQAVSWTGFDVNPLSNAGGKSSVATGINNAGMIAGYVEGYPGTENPQAVIWQGTTATVLSNLRQSSPYSIAYGLNGDGVVVGAASDDAGSIRAVVWSGGQVAALDKLSVDDQARSINSVGKAVGTMDSNGGAAHAALWDTKTGTGVDLNSFVNPGVIPDGITLVEARGINDAGDIVGISYNKATGYFGAFELLAVPEASTMAMWGIGLMGLFTARRRHHSRT